MKNYPMSLNPRYYLSVENCFMFEHRCPHCNKLHMESAQEASFNIKKTYSRIKNNSIDEQDYVTCQKCSAVFLRSCPIPLEVHSNGEQYILTCPCCKTLKTYIDKDCSKVIIQCERGNGIVGVTSEKEIVPKEIGNKKIKCYGIMLFNHKNHKIKQESNHKFAYSQKDNNDDYKHNAKERELEIREMQVMEKEEIIEKALAEIITEYKRKEDNYNINFSSIGRNPYGIADGLNCRNCRMVVPTTAIYCPFCQQLK